MWSSRRYKPPTPDGILPKSSSVPLWAGAAWELSVTLGRVTVLLGAVFVLILLLSGVFPVRDWLAAVLPAGVANFFSQPAHNTESHEMEELRESVRNQIAETVKKSERASAPSSQSRHFTAGSTKAEVLAIQGTPDAASADEWTYGASKVFFSQDRVVGWRSATSNPLKAR